jgi:GNAT superfamily N-acetyltransferase
MALVVRQATTKDGPDLARLRWTWRTEGQSPAPDDVDDFRGQFEAWWIQRDVHDAFVARVDDVAVGMGFLAVVTRVPNPGDFERHQGDIQSLYVLESHRGDGIGALLVEALLDHARQLGCFRVTVNASARAVPLYEREGFEHAHKQLLHPLGDIQPPPTREDRRDAGRA